AFDQVRKLAPGGPLDRDGAYFIAISEAKLGVDFPRVVSEWERWFALGNGKDDPRMLAQVETNLAESYMTVGRLPDAILHYRKSAQLDPTSALTLFGLAVALDRDEQQPEARRVMQKALGLDKTMASLGLPEVFFIPMGDVHYYYALGHDVGGH